MQEIHRIVKGIGRGLRRLLLCVETTYCNVPMSLLVLQRVLSLLILILVKVVN
jgi:hypothetical protein